MHKSMLKTVALILSVGAILMSTGCTKINTNVEPQQYTAYGRYYTDDIILGVVYDRNTAIYDDLETALGDKFELEREGNNIRIMTLERVDNK